MILENLNKILLVVILFISTVSIAQPRGIEEIRQLVEKENFVEAREALDDVMSDGNESSEVYAMSAWTNANLIADTEDKETKFSLLDQAINEIQIAIRMDSLNAWNHFCYAVIHGLKAERENNPKEKLRYVKLIKKESDIALSLDPRMPEIYYLQGRWHLELSKLSWIERVGADLFLGGFPDGVSMEACYDNFGIALEKDPECVIYNLGLARAYIADENYTLARMTLENTLKLPDRSVHDTKRKKTARELLSEIRNNN